MEASTRLTIFFSQENRQATLASIEEQRRSIRDMQRLQQELERGIQDRRSEIHRLADEVDGMRDALHELGTTTGFYGNSARAGPGHGPGPGWFSFLFITGCKNLSS
jgi:chromosome segregation ATPase